MKSYRISAPHFVAVAIVDEDVIVQTAPILGWSVGKYFTHLRDYAQQRGWVVEPLEETTRPTWLERDGTVYELTWSDDVLVRITAHESGEESRDITWQELPESVRGEL